MAGKADIVDYLVDNVDGLTKKQAAEAFEGVFDAITEILQDGERVSIPGFGSLTVVERAARQGRNPATGATITIPASKNVRFKPGKDLKEAVND